MRIFDFRAGACAAECAAALVLAAAPALADDTTAGGADYSLFDPVPDNALRPFCTDRPTKGTGPCTVDAGHLQIESDLFNVTFQNSGGTVTDTYLYTNPNFRLGIADNTDVEASIAPFAVVDTHIRGARTEISGTGDLFLRVKTNLAGNGSGDFSAAFDPFLKVPTAPIGIGNGAVEAGAVVPVSMALSDVWSLTAVPEIDVLKNALDQGRHAAGITAVSATWAPSNEYSATAELWGEIDGDPSGAVEQYSFDFAGTWQPPGSTDLQLDAGVNLGLNANTPGAQIYVGVSRRF